MNRDEGIAAHAEPGKVLVSGSVAEAGSPEGVSLVEAGEVQLKGFPRPVMLFEACRI
jgi:class 3 adenylate cyclase